jgi:hypothetical protein
MYAILRYKRSYFVESAHSLEFLFTSITKHWGTERFTIGNFTIPIVKRSFLKRIFIFFLGEKKEHFTIG